MFYNRSLLRLLLKHPNTITNRMSSKQGKKSQRPASAPPQRPNSNSKASAVQEQLKVSNVATFRFSNLDRDQLLEEFSKRFQKIRNALHERNEQCNHLATEIQRFKRVTAITLINTTQCVVPYSSSLHNTYVHHKYVNHARHTARINCTQNSTRNTPYILLLFSQHTPPTVFNYVMFRN